MVFEDGTVETWEFPPSQPGFYREGRNSSGEGRGYRSWFEHEIWWQSNKMVVESETTKPVLDNNGRATGYVEP